MSHIHLKQVAAEKPAWKSTVLANVGGANVKVMEMDGSPYPNESHDYPECLLVVNGQLNLQFGEDLMVIRAGEMFIVPAGTPHAVAPGSSGVCLIVDQ